MRESNIGGAALPGPSPCSVRSAGCAAGVDDKAQQFVTHHPKSLPPTHPHSTLLLVPWDAGADRCARQASSLSTSREMKVQRSIGKKILAVVAGAGLAVGGLTIGPAAADEHWEIPGGGPETCPPPLESWECFPPTVGPDPIVDPPTDDGKVDEGLPSVIDQPVQVAAPCWTAGNCPVGGALQTAVPQYMIAGAPMQIVVYAAWRPDENTAGAPSNGDAVISMDGEPIAAAPFADGKATFNFTPTVPGLKEIVISGVLNSNTSGANAWIDSVDAPTMVLPYDPELFEELLKNKNL